jgi:acyl-CoA synthetase (NDP forming)
LGILCADACEAAGLTVQELRDSTKSLLKQFLPITASVMNPVDMIASATAEEFRKAVEILLSAEELDSLIVLTIDVEVVDIAAIAAAIYVGAGAARTHGGSGKPLLTCLMDGEKARRVTGAGGERFPDYAFPENAARVLGKLARYAAWRAQPEDVILDFDDIEPRAARAVCQQALETYGEGWLSAEDARKVLSAFALPMPRGGVSHTADEAVQLAEELGFPVALKLASRKIIHKSDIGGVRLSLKDASGVREAFEAICARLLVQPMIPGGVELMIGVTQDPLFGPLIAFGLGGIHVEILKDVCFRVTPITTRDAGEMVRSIRGYRLLQGYRGHPAADITAVEDVLLRIARLVEEVPEISELDLNPVIALPPGQGCIIIDTRIRVAALH